MLWSLVRDDVCCYFLTEILLGFRFISQTLKREKLTLYLSHPCFSWNSPRGWCSSCRGYGRIWDWMKDELPASGNWWTLEDGAICPTCKGDRLNPVGRNIFLYSRRNKHYSLPELLALPPSEIEIFLKTLKIAKKKNLLLMLFYRKFLND